MSEFLKDDVDALAAYVHDGAKLALIYDGEAVSMAAARAIIRRGVRNLHVVTVPMGGFQTDMLIGAGCVRIVETSGVSLGEYGQAPNFGNAVKNGTIEIKDATCPAIYAALQAAEKGIPFIPFRGLIGSDILRYRKDWAVIDNPFQAGDRIVVLPAVQPDFAVFHAPKADRFGNVWIGRFAEQKIMAHAAKNTLVTVEEVVDGNLMTDDQLAPATIPSLYVTAFAVAEKGAWPIGLPGFYGPDAENLADYAERARTEDGFKSYLDEFVFHRKAAAE